MPVELGIWRLGESIERVAHSPIDSEGRLESAIVKDLSLIAPDLLLIGSQVLTSYGGRIDILALDSQAKLVIVELKRNKTPREVVAQALDYATWVKVQSFDEISNLYAQHNKGRTLTAAFEETFGSPFPDELSNEHQLVIVASALDSSTERIIDYLVEDYGVPINAVFFRYFNDGGREYLTRTWLLDPMEAEVKSKSPRRSSTQESWNGRDYYVALGEGEDRTWDDCAKYGFISAGGGRWYHRLLYMLLKPGCRIFACIPSVGYVGWGVVQGEARPARDMKVILDGCEIPLLEAPLKAPQMSHDRNDDVMCEHAMPVLWNKTLKREEAIWEKGMFANQNTACRLRHAQTIQKLYERFGIEE